MNLLCILTGASRGLGAALARGLLARGADLLCLSRGFDPALQREGDGAGRRLEQWRVDLAEARPVAARVEDWLQARGPQGSSHLLLVNNAAVLETPGAFEAQPEDDIVCALRVGLEAPLLLSRAVLRASADWPVERRILNISSGLGRRPLAGVATYCAIKAGLDHFSRTLAEEQADSANPARVCALAPGIIDTGMQVQLRGADPQAFAARPVFESFHASGALDTPERAAAKVIEVLLSARFGAQAVADVRD
ncbi:SDR family NAD(P)-dependent oxidoreductase [Aquimonas voraii]|uniref:NAD(P)-dependent dehydrogenase, short-chain alcohol dehydrogenase family n=1 Tax=Aquimonas voraii TaxID=265719 RepID=A0A1G6SS22_9GAMM|nr:SDR family NAD(P)-dependent oxidoreductase [Aquimonas voraii]SDD19619.1 NAD(P)-dependent dehydrogenase, short-chain alcohol dehydrogenase family [Aquimonas voraii]